MTSKTFETALADDRAAALEALLRVIILPALSPETLRGLSSAMTSRADRLEAGDLFPADPFEALDLLTVWASQTSEAALSGSPASLPSLKALRAS